MSNLSAKSLSQLSTLIKTADLTALELTYTGPGLDERLAATPLTEPLHKVINAVLRDQKGRTSLEIHEIVKERGFTEQDVRVCMQNIYKRKLVITLPSEIGRIAYRMAGRGEFWPDDIVSPTPAVTSAMANKLSKKSIELPAFDAKIDPNKDIVPGDRIELAIWKLFGDGEGRRMPEIVDALKPYQYDPKRVKDAMRRLSTLRWFEFTTGHSSVTYKLKEGIPMPYGTTSLEAAPVDIPAPVLDLQKDGIRRTLWKIMSDFKPRTNVEIAEILAPMCDSTAYLKYEMMQLVKLGWFLRNETNHPVNQYLIIIYTLKDSIKRPDAEPLTAKSKFYRAPTLTSLETLDAIHAAINDGQPDLTSMIGSAPAQASLLPPAASEPGDLNVARNLGLQATNVHQFRHPDANPAAAEAAIRTSKLSAGAREFHALHSNGIVPQTTGYSVKEPVIADGLIITAPADGPLRSNEVQLKDRAILHNPPEWVGMDEMVSAVQAIKDAMPLVEHCVYIRGKRIDADQADALVEELSDLGMGDERQMIQSPLVKVKLEIAGMEFRLDEVDQIVLYLKSEGFGKSRKH